MLTVMHATGASTIVRSSIGFVVETAAKWAIDELSPKAHHLSFQDVQTLHSIFQPLFKEDQEAIQCFAHLVSSKQTDPQQDIRYPAATKGTLKLTQIDRLAASEINRALGTVQEYLEKGLTLYHGKINRNNNYHYAVAAGILNWFHHRLPVWLSECIANPAKIDVVFDALLQSLDKLKAQDTAKEKHDIIDGLARVIKNELVPELKCIVANKSAANHFADMEKAAAQASIDGQKMVAVLSHQAHTEKQPNLVFYTLPGAKDGYFCEQAGNNTLIIGAPLIPKVPLQGLLANGLRESARIAIDGNIAVIAPSVLVLDDKEKKAAVNTLHPACLTKPVVESGNKNVKLVDIDEAQQIKNIEHLQQLLFRFSELQALSRLFGRFERFAAFVGGKAMFNPKFLQKTLGVLKNKLHNVNQQILSNPLFQQVDTLMDCGKFTKTHKDCLNYGEGNETPNLKQLVQDIKSNLNAMDKAMQAIDFKRANFDQVVQDAMDDQKAIIAGIQTIVGDQALVDDISQELQQASGLRLNAVDENEYDETIRPALEGTLTAEQYLAMRDQLNKQLNWLCDLHNKSEAIDTPTFANFLRKVFEGTVVQLEWVKDVKEKRLLLRVNYIAWSCQAIEKIHVAVKTVINQVIIAKLNQQNQIQMEAMKRHQSQALWPKNSEACYRHLKLIDAYLQENKPLNDPEFLALMEPLLALEPAVDKKFVAWLNGLLPKNYLKLEQISENFILKFRRPLFEEENVINQLIKLSNHGVNVGGWRISIYYLPFGVLDQVFNPILQKGGKFVRIRSSRNHRLNHRGLSEVRFVVTDQDALNKLLADEKTYKAISKGLAKLAQPPLQLSTPPKTTYNYTHKEKEYQQLKTRVADMLAAMEKPLAVISDSAMVNQQWIQVLQKILNVQAEESDDKHAQKLVATELIPQLIAIQNLKKTDDVEFNQNNYEHQLNKLFQGTGIKFDKNDSGDIQIDGQQSQPISLDCVKKIQKNIQDAYGDLNTLPATITKNIQADEAVLKNLNGIAQVAQQIAVQTSPEYEDKNKQINELEAELIIVKKLLKKEAENHLQSNEEYISKINKMYDEHSKKEQEDMEKLNEIQKDHAVLIDKVNDYQTKLNDAKIKFSEMQVTANNAIQQVNTLQISENKLKNKNQELYDLLRCSLEKTLTGINSIIDNNSQLLYIVFGIKQNIKNNAINSSLEINELSNNDIDSDMFSEMALDEDQQAIIKMSAQIGARQRHKDFIQRFIKEVEQSILKNQEIAVQLQNELKESLQKGNNIKNDIDELNKIANEQLSALTITVQTQKGIVNVLNQIINGLQNEINQLKDELVNKNKRIIKLNNDKKLADDEHKREKEQWNKSKDEALEIQRKHLQTTFNDQIHKMMEEFKRQTQEKDEVIKKQQTERVRQESDQTDNALKNDDKVEAEPTTTKPTNNDYQLGAYADKSGWSYFWYVVGDWTIAAIPNFFIGLGSGFGLWGNFQSLFAQRAWRQHEETEKYKEHEETAPNKTNNDPVKLETSQTKITKQLPKSSSSKSTSLLNANDHSSNDETKPLTNQQSDQSIVPVIKHTGSPMINQSVKQKSHVPDLTPSPNNDTVLLYV